MTDLENTRTELEDLRKSTAADRRQLTENIKSLRHQLSELENKLAELEPLKTSKLATEEKVYSLRRQLDVANRSIGGLKRTLASIRWNAVLSRLKLRIRNKRMRMLESMAAEEDEYLTYNRDEDLSYG